MMKTASINGNLKLEEIKKFLEKQYKLEYTEQEWKEHVQNYKFDETCQGSVTPAYRCFLSTLG